MPILKPIVKIKILHRSSITEVRIYMNMILGIIGFKGDIHTHIVYELHISFKFKNISLC